MEHKEKELSANNISFRYKNHKSRLDSFVIKNLQEIKISSEEIVSIIGRSGTGKSTLLRIMAGLEKPDKGSVTWKLSKNGENYEVKQPDAPVIEVFQNYNRAVFPWLNIEQNISLGRFKSESNHFGITEICNKLFREDAKDVNSFLKTYPKELSGGQRQRIQLGRALYSGAEFLLFDEPDSSLDVGFKETLREVVILLARKHRKGVVIATHDIDQATYLSNRVIILHRSREKKEIELDVVRGFQDLGTKLKYNQAIKHEEFINIKSEIIKKIFEH